MVTRLPSFSLPSLPSTVSRPSPGNPNLPPVEGSEANVDALDLSSDRVAQFKDDAAQLNRFSNRLSALSLASTAGVFALALFGGPAVLVPALCLAAVSGVSCVVSFSSEDEAQAYEDKARDLEARLSGAQSTNAPTTLMAFDPPASRT
jgi:hypothetical protein